MGPDGDWALACGARVAASATTPMARLNVFVVSFILLRRRPMRF
jgi:hypothetical protein